MKMGTLFFATEEQPMNSFARTVGTLALGLVLLGAGRLPAAQAQVLHHHHSHYGHSWRRYHHARLPHPGVYIHYGVHHSHHRYH